MSAGARHGVGVAGLAKAPRPTAGGRVRARGWFRARYDAQVIVRASRAALRYPPIIALAACTEATMTASTEGATDTAATTDSGPTSLDTGSETGHQTTAGGDTDGSKPDLGAAPDEHCANPGPWPLPEAPLLELPRFVAHSYIDLDQIGWMTEVSLERRS